MFLEVVKLLNPIPSNWRLTTVVSALWFNLNDPAYQDADEIVATVHSLLLST